VLQLIEGSGEFVTFLAQLDREATRNGLQLELFEPVVVAPPPPEPPKGGNQNKQQAPASPPKAPLEQAGLSAQRVLLTARGRFPNLLAFMRSVERLSLLVVPSDFSLQSISAGAGAPNAQTFDSEMKLALTYYQAPDSGLKPAAEAKPSKPPKTNPAS
jgi:type IV pilus assembly protein PilO